MPSVRQAIFPYGMARNADGSWTFFNRQYKPVGVVSDEWAEWDDSRHKVWLKGLTEAVKVSLNANTSGPDGHIYFYHDGSVPEASAANMRAYMERLGLLLRLEESDERADPDPR